MLSKLPKKKGFFAGLEDFLDFDLGVSVIIPIIEDELVTGVESTLLLGQVGANSLVFESSRVVEDD